MRKNILLFICMCLCTLIYAQTDKMPQAISYQAVARDAAGKVLTEKSIGVKVEILKGSTRGSAVYSETHKPKSSTTGTITLLIGQGTASTGTFTNINWGADTYYLQLSMDIQGGSDYKVASTTQMLPVPFALYAAKAGSVENGGSGEGGDNRPKFILTTADGLHTQMFYSVMSGELVTEIPTGTDQLGGFNLDINLLYLDGKDQKLDIVLEGLPEGAKLGNKYGEESMPSTPIGRYIRTGAYDIPLGEHNLKLVVKNEQKDTVKEYPFKYTAK